MAFLHRQQIHHLHNAVVKARLSNNRETLLGGIDVRFVSALPIASDNSAQILSDLHALNETMHLENGSVPLRIWIENAINLVGAREEVHVLRRALQATQSFEMRLEMPSSPDGPVQASAVAALPVPPAPPPPQAQAQQVEPVGAAATGYPLVQAPPEFLDEHDVDSSQTSRWDIDFNAIIKLPTTDPWRWTVVLSRDEASRHGDLMISLKRRGDRGKPRYIDSGFAYWGIGPTIQWRKACQDSFYTVMRKGIETFQRRWITLLGKLTRRLPSIYVSYGVGTGEKDNVVLTTLNTARPPAVYVPIDMSLDMLVNGAKVASRGVIEPGRVIPLQIDFSSTAELATVSDIRQNVLGGRPTLFSLLGNTLANFEDDVATLKTLAELMKKDDLLLIELAATQKVDAKTADMAADEYANIPSLEKFIRSALTQHTDLPLNEIDYHGEACHDGEALQIDMSYVSAKRCRGRLMDGSTIELRPKEKLRVYRSRKYTHMAIKRILQFAGLDEIVSDITWNGQNSPFGLYLGMCGK